MSNREQTEHLTATLEATHALGAAWAARCRGGEIFALHGPLGAGKTQLTKGIARGLGYRGEVTSPTFSLLHEYLGGRLPLYHLDLYRIAGPSEAHRFGIEDYLESGGICVIEWPERIEGLLPTHTEHWEISPAPGDPAARRIFLRRIGA